jgi:hypothetical protein
MRRDSPSVSAMVPSKSKIRDRYFILCGICAAERSFASQNPWHLA